jgi:hypothetical protein
MITYTSRGSDEGGVHGERLLANLWLRVERASR